MLLATENRSGKRKGEEIEDSQHNKGLLFLEFDSPRSPENQLLQSRGSRDLKTV